MEHAGFPALNFFRPIRPLLVGWLVSFVAWGAVAVVLGAEAVGRGDGFWSVAVRNGLRDWGPWALLSPVLFRFVARFPVERHRWFAVWPAHLAVCAATIVGVNLWKSGFDKAWPASRGLRVGGPPAIDDRSPGGPPGPPPGGNPGSGPPGIDLFHIVSFELPIYLALITGAHILVYRRRLDERAASLARARLEMLRAQLQPHFLFNTLNTIAGLVHDEPDKADAMLVALSDLLRMSLETSSEIELPLDREIEYVEKYLSIIRARFADRISCEIEIDPEARSGLVPAFILQPLVENAVEHGLQTKGGTVSVRAQRNGSRLRVIVADDGAGFAPTAAEGIGLGNTRERLEQLHGGNARLSIEKASGTRIVLDLPYRA